MIINTDALEEQYKNFINNAIAAESVWTLVHDDELALLDSQLYDDVLATPFFSSETAAFSLKNDEWYDYTVVKIDLSDFLEKWLIGLFNQDIMVAAIWNDVATGREFEPLELLIEFLQQLNQNNSEIDFKAYASIEEFMNRIQDTLSDLR
jgi:hypothetical protein